MKALIDYLPLVAFGGAYFAYDIYVATGVLMAALVLLVAFHRIAYGEWHKMHLATAALALVFGGITLAVHDPMFIKVKPTVLYLLFAAVLAGSHVVGERPLMQRILGGQLVLPERVWRTVSWMWTIFFLVCAVLNLIVAFSFSDTVWVNFKLFGILGLTLVFVLGQGLYLSPYLKEQEE